MFILFSISSARDQIRKKKPSVSWWKIVWFTKAIPRHAFITWLAIRDSLSTNDMIASWGITCDLLCKGSFESRDQFFPLVPLF